MANADPLVTKKVFMDISIGGEKAERIVKQNYPNSLFTEYFNGGFTADEPMCEEISWKVNYKWRKK